MAGTQGEPNSQGIHWLTLRFGIKGTEQEFLESQRETLIRSWNRLNCIFALATGPMSMYIYFSTREAPVQGPASIWLHQLVTYGIGTACAFFVTLVTCRHKWLDGLSTSTLESLVLLEGTLPLTAILNLDSFYIGRMKGIPAPRMPEMYPTAGGDSVAIFSDSRVLLLLVMVLVAANIMVVSRFFKVIILNVACVLIYAAVAAFGSCEGWANWAFNLFIFSCIAVMVSAGKYRTERLQRKLMLMFISEKTLRFEIEFKREESNVRERTNATAQADGESQSQARTSMSSIPASQAILDLQPDEEVRKIQMAAMPGLGRKEQWLIEVSQLNIYPTQLLGSGAFGIVLKGELLGCPVAVKVPISEKLVGLRQLSQELRILRKVSHPNIVSFHGACVLPQSEHLLLVNEYISGRSLRSLLNHSQCLDYAQLCNVFRGICGALGYMHGLSPAVVHGDLKPDNVMITEDNAVKLIDFGLSVVSSRHQKLRGGSIKYSAPELLTGSSDGSCRDQSPADMFSFGRLVYVTVTQLCPVGDHGKEELKEMARQGLVPELIWPAGPLVFLEECKELCQRCLPVRPECRASAAQVDMLLCGWSRRVLLQGQIRPDERVTDAVSFPAAPEIDNLEDALELAISKAWLIHRRGGSKSTL